MPHPYVPFWRSKPFTGEEEALLDALAAAHRHAAQRENGSTAACRNAAAGSGSVEAAIASAVLTLGRRHGPVADVMRILRARDPQDAAEQYFIRGEKVPGFGCSFADSGFGDVFRELSPWPVYSIVLRVTAAVQAVMPQLKPNPAMASAAVGYCIGLPPECGSYLLVAPRLAEWYNIAREAL